MSCNTVSIQVLSLKFFFYCVLKSEVIEKCLKTEKQSVLLPIYMIIKLWHKCSIDKYCNIKQIMVKS